jgi:hypothetical protein
MLALMSCLFTHPQQSKSTITDDFRKEYLANEKSNVNFLLKLAMSHGLDMAWRLVL